MKPELIVALDVDGLCAVEALLNKLAGRVKIFKIGSQLFTALGPRVIEVVQNAGAEVFLDLKFHDIPNTVSHAIGAACKYSPAILTVHTCGGSEMLRAAVESRDHAESKTKIVGVTVLTSLDKGQLEEIGISASVNEQVVCLAQMARAAGLDGVVASPQEIAIIRHIIGQEFLIVTPGIRPQGPMRDDQRRVMTASEAVAAGANYLVVGRPITQAPDPLAATEAILKDIG